MPDLPPATHADLVFIGAGPKTTGILLALAATEGAGDGLRIHLIDPYPAGAGRIWRTAQSPHLWMNSRTEDITIFPDADASLGRPPITGPTLHEWIHDEGRERLHAAGLGEEAERLDSQSFASRRVQGHYLEWAFDTALERLAADVRIHRTLAEAVVRLPAGRGFRVVTSEGEAIEAEVVVSAQGHLDMDPFDSDLDLERAASTGLYYQRPGFTADLDFSAIPPGADVLTRGFGLAFIDLMVMVTQGRGGEFFECEDRLRYHASGREPVLWVGSSRGVSYSPKLGYSRADLPGAPGVELRYLAAEQLKEGAVHAGDGTIDFRTVIGPLAELELTYAHYDHVLWKRDLRGRGPGSGDCVLEQIDAVAAGILTDPDSGDRQLKAGRVRIAAAAAGLLHDPADLFDLGAIDRPLDDLRCDHLGAGEDAVRSYIEDHLERSADIDHSADLAVFEALVKTYVAIRLLVRSGRVGPEDRTAFVEGSFHSLFSYIGSGPPPTRVRQILALHEAGLVRFLGPGLRVDATEQGFRAASSAHPDSRTFTYLVEARLAKQSAARAVDPALASLAHAGAILLEGEGEGGGVGEGGGGGTGSRASEAAKHAKLRTDAHGHALDEAGRQQPDLFLLGPAVSGATAEAFTRPHTDAPVFKDNERIASALLDSLVAAGRTGAGTRDREQLLAG